MLSHEAAANVAGTGSHERSQRDQGSASARRSLLGTFLAQAGVVVLGTLLCSTTIAAQSVTPNEAAQPEAPSPAPASASEVARTAVDPDHRSLLELQRLQLRENELWDVRNRHPIAWPGVGLGLGLAGAVTMIPFGSALLAAGHSMNTHTYDGTERDDIGERVRITGGIFLGLGITALVTAVVCGLHVRRLRPMRRAADKELRAVRLLRIRMLDALTLPSEPRRAG
jgi:hypothetical protein